MIKDKAHTFTVSTDSFNGGFEGGNQVTYRTVQHIRQCCALQVSPDTLDKIQVRTVRRQPEDLELIRMLGQKRLYRLGMMKAGVVANQSNLLARVGLQQDHQEGDEVPTTLGLGDGIDHTSGRVIDPAINHPLFVLAGSRDLGLCAIASPHPGQGRMQMDFDLILEDQDLVSLRVARFFLSLLSCFLALAWAFSSRLPRRVCLGRCREKPS